MIDRPYFMERKEWFTYDPQKRQFVLTDKAPKEAKKSYDEYLKELTKHINGD